MKNIYLAISLSVLLFSNTTFADSEQDAIIEQHSQSIEQLTDSVIGMDEMIQENADNQLLKDNEQDSRIDKTETGKLDKSTFEENKTNQEITDKDQDSKISDVEKTKVDGTMYQNDKVQQSDRDTQQDQSLTKESEERKTDVGTINAQISKESSDRLESVNGINSSIDTIKTENGKTVESVTSAHSRITTVESSVSNNTQTVNGIKSQVNTHEKQLVNHETRLSGLEKSTNENFSHLRNEIDRNKKDNEAAIAGVAAMANIPQVLEHQKFNIGAGIGAHGNQQAIAVGFSARVSNEAVTKFSISADTRSGVSAGAGFSYGW